MREDFSYFHGLICAIARCDDFDFYLEAKNAHGVGAKHAYTYGHTVHIDVTRGSTITPKGSEWETSWNKGH